MKFSFCFSSLLKPVQISPNATNTKMINIIYPTKTIIIILSNLFFFIFCLLLHMNASVFLSEWYHRMIYFSKYAKGKLSP